MPNKTFKNGYSKKSHKQILTNVRKKADKNNSHIFPNLLKSKATVNAL